MLPKRPSAQVAWNCSIHSHHQKPLADDAENARGSYRNSIEKPRREPSAESMSVTFDMNRLQDIPFPGEPGSPGRVLVSMNPTREPKAVQSIHIYDHPVINSESVLATQKLALLNAAPNLSFAGAWMGYGFHEDGFAAGATVARKILGRLENPQDVAYGNQLPEFGYQWSIVDQIIRGLIRSVQWVIERTG